MKTKAGEKNRITLLVCLLLLALLTSTQMVCGVYARYAVTGSASDSARVAAFVFTTQDGEINRLLDLSGIQKPGDSRSYSFIISNQNASAVSEVAERIRFSVQLNGSMPLACTITKNGETTPVLSAEIAENVEMNNPVSADSADVVFPAAVGRTETYTLTATWPVGANDAKYANRSAAAELQLTVKAEQID